MALAHLRRLGHRHVPGKQAEFVLIDNGSTDRNAHPARGVAPEQSDVTVRSTRQGPFNWARLNNKGVGRSAWRVLLCLNDDIEARSEGWLSLLRSHALRPDAPR